MQKVLLCTKVAILTSLSLLFFSCGGNVPAPGTQEGEIVLNLKSNLDVSIKKSDVAPGENIDDYSINIYKGDTPYAGWDKYSELPTGKIVRLAYGSYTAMANWGENLPIAFDSPYFIGSTDFVINSKSESTPVNITCALGNAQVKVVYTDAFKTHFSGYKSYRMDIYTDHTTSAFPYTSTETRPAYFKVSKLMLRVVLEKMDGTVYDYGLNHITGVQARDSYTVNVNVTTTDGNGAISVVVDESTNAVSSEQTVLFDEVFKKFTSVKNSFDDNLTTLSLFPEATYNLSTYFYSSTGIKDIVFYPSEVFAKDCGLPTEVSFAALATNAELKAKMAALGFDWKEDFVGKSELIVRYSDILKHIQTERNENYTHNFGFAVIDSDSKSTIKNFSIIATPLVFAAPAIDLATVWTKEASLSQMTANEYKYPDYNSIKDNTVYQYSGNGIDWVDVAPDENKALRITALTHNTEYRYRVKVGRYTSGVLTFKTEEAKALPNGDLNTWGSKSVNNQFLGSDENEFWATRNTQTSSSGVDQWYAKNSGTRRLDLGNGNSAADITTIGWGAGNTWAGFMGTAIIYNFNAGCLLIGNVNSGGVITKGKPFASRPTKVAFDYKYAPKNSNTWKMEVEVISKDASGNITVLGSGSIDGSSEVKNFTNQVVDITYTNTSIPATDIYVFFTNSTKGSHGKSDIGKYSDPNRYMGSILSVDNVTLTYDK